MFSNLSTLDKVPYFTIADWFVILVNSACKFVGKFVAVLILVHGLSPRRNSQREPNPEVLTQLVTIIVKYDIDFLFTNKVLNEILMRFIP